MYIYYTLYFSDKSETENITTHSGRGTGETSSEIQPPIDKNEGVFYKSFYLICSSSSYLLNMNDINNSNYIFFATYC